MLLLVLINFNTFSFVTVKKASATTSDTCQANILIKFTIEIKIMIKNDKNNKLIYLHKKVK